MRSSLSLLLLLCFASVCTAQVPWKTDTYYNRLFSEQTVADLLREFAADQQLPIVIDNDTVTGVVRSQYPKMPPKDYLERVTEDNGLIWYYDGHALFIYRSNQLESQVVPLNLTLEELTGTLKSLGVYSEKYRIRALPEHGLVYIVGPPRYQQVIKQTLEGIALTARQRANVDVTVEVFPLRYAWADDQSLRIGENDVLIPGVATLLNNVLSNGGPISLRGRVSRPIPRNRNSLSGFGLQRSENQRVANAEEAAFNAQLAAAQAQAQAQAQARILADVQSFAAQGQGSNTQANAALAAQQQVEAALAQQVQATIQADPRLNAIIIRDVRDRMPFYRRIIEHLDRPSGLVEIKATIIDVDADTGFQFGPPSHAIFQRNGVQRTVAGSLTTDSSTNITSTAAQISNFTFSLMRGQVTDLLVNLKALETDGHAKTIAKPSIMTINNVEAFLEESEEFYVRVPGFEQVDLFNVTVGTKLQITPHIVYEPDGRRVKLIVRVEDGARSATASVDMIPVVSRNVINTQAVLLEGQSLLIGGLMRDEETKTVRGLPVISRIPKLGAMFRETVHATKRTERLVLLTPTIVDLPNTPSGLLPSSVLAKRDDNSAPQPSQLLPPLPYSSPQSVSPQPAAPPATNTLPPPAGGNPMAPPAKTNPLPAPAPSQSWNQQPATNHAAQYPTYSGQQVSHVSKVNSQPVRLPQTTTNRYRRVYRATQQQGAATRPSYSVPQNLPAQTRTTQSRAYRLPLPPK